MHAPSDKAMNPDGAKSKPCPKCRGKGKIADKICPACGGAGYVKRGGYQTK